MLFSLYLTDHAILQPRYDVLVHTWTYPPSVDFRDEHISQVKVNTV